MNRNIAKGTVVLWVLVLLSSCTSDESATVEPNPENPESPTPDLYVLPVVVHVLHQGEPVGEGTNVSEALVQRQIEILNEDFRRKENTRGYNNSPISMDARIEFVLAKKSPEGSATNGIVRKKLEVDEIPADIPNLEYEKYAYFSYWDSEDYINIWVVPYPDNLNNVLLGKATGPDSDLPGDEWFQKPLPGGAEGIIINQAHFGETHLMGGHNLGRTLTHEMGHYLGLLHTWGTGDCATNDYCADTPAVDDVVTKSEPYLGCAGEEVMIENYMNYTPDAIMNIFTNDQIERMHYVLENSPRRNSLLFSSGK